MRVEAVDLRLRLGQAADLFAAGSITAAQLSRITAEVNDRLAEVEAKMARAARGTALGPLLATRRDPAAVWPRLDVETRRAVIRELLKVTVQPSGRSGNRFDPRLCSIEWK